MATLSQLLRICERRVQLPRNVTHARKRFLSTATKPATTQRETKENKGQKSQETTSFVMNIFAGHLKTEQIFPFPDVLTEEERETLNMVKEPTAKMYEGLSDPLKNEENKGVDENVMEALRNLGAFGIQVPTEYGGAGLNNTQSARLGEITGAHDIGICVMLGAHQSIGYKGLLLYGTDEQKKKYLPDLASGKRMASFCLTEPGSGSDAGSIQTKAVPTADGKHFILNGSKLWITNGGLAEFFTVFAQTPVKNQKGETVNQVSAFIVERSFEGVSSGPPENKMGIRCSNTAEVFFDNVKVPAENLLGPLGGGFKVAMNILNSGRFGMSAILTGCMKECIRKAVDHANNRVQFGNKIATYGAVQEKIARMAMAHYTTESLAYMVSGVMDRGFQDFHLEAAIGKVFASEAAWFVCDETMQILGGISYMKGTGVEKVLRDLRIFRIFEGANDVLRLFVALTGLQYAGGSLKELQRAMRNPVANLGMIFDEGTKRVFRAVGLGSGVNVQDHVAPRLQNSAALVSKAIENFGASVEHLLMKYNKNIVNEQFLLSRLGNAAIDIYTSAVVLSRATRSIKSNLHSAEYEAQLVDVITAEACKRVQDNLASMRYSDTLKNYDTMKRIAQTVCSKDGVAHIHPIDGI